MDKASRKDTRGKKAESGDSTTETKSVDPKSKTKVVVKKPAKDGVKANEKNGEVEIPAVENGASSGVKGKGDNAKETASKVKKPTAKSGSGKIED